MELTGEQFLALPRESVWRALNDPDTLKLCVPGCDAFESIEEHQYKVVMTAAVGPVKAKFSGKLTISDLVPPQSYALAFEGSGGAAGFGKGDARVTLEEQDGGTRLQYAVNAKVGGRLAQVGARLIDGVAKKMADEFFTRFKTALAPQSAAAASGAAGATEGTASSSGAAGVASVASGSSGSSAPAATGTPVAPPRRRSANQRLWAFVVLIALVLIGYYIKR
jgi:carbon monoxide dehydrogenase subunit G